jgi:hypothetical protein
MAMLQAARAFELGLPKDSAYSWGLNRAIFYAAAKRGFKDGGARPSGKSHGATKTHKEIKNTELNEFYLGTEKAFIDKEKSKKDLPIFSIGDSVQNPKDFEKQVISRFGGEENFDTAWQEALKVVGQHERSILESQEEFYEQVYKPRRDTLSREWSERFAKKSLTSVRG